MQVVELPYLVNPSDFTQPELRNGIMNSRINGAMEMIDGTLFASKLVVGAQTWAHNITWTATDYNTASWSSGTLQLAGGGSYPISSGNTGNISARTYIYFNKTSTLQTTTTYSDAVSDETILLAVVDPDADTDANTVITAFGSPGTTIDGDTIITGKIQSVNGLTFFDLNNNLIQISDGTDTTIIDQTGLVSSANFSFGSVTDSNSQTTTSTSFTDVTNMTLSFSLDRAARVLFLSTMSGGNDSVNTGNSQEGRMVLDGTQIGGLLIMPGIYYDLGGSSVIYHTTGSCQTIQSVTSGSHTVKLQFRCTSGGTARLGSNAKFIGYVVLGK